MNLNIIQLMNQNFDGFIKLIELGIIDKEVACRSIIESNNPNYIFKFARDVENSNIDALEAAIIKTENARYIYWFAFAIYGANIEKLEAAVIKTEDAEFIYKFAKYVEKANVEELENAIIKTVNAEFIYYFAIHVKGANIKRLKYAINQTKNDEFIILFDKKVNNNENLEKLIMLLETRKYQEILKNSEIFTQLFKDDVEEKSLEKTLKINSSI